MTDHTMNHAAEVVPAENAAIVASTNLSEALIGNISQCGSVVVAYSGGLDSSVVLWAATQALPVNKILAVTSTSPSYPLGEADEARAFVRSLGLPDSAHRCIQTKEMEIAGYYENNPNRCYYCKHELYGELEKIRSEGNYATVLDGLNQSDMNDFRPGRIAAEEFGVRSPLLECGLDKDAVRQIARDAGLTVAEKPASPCLSSRVPHGVTITTEVLRKIDVAESALHGMGFRGFRVRYHLEVARLELAPSDFSRLLNDDTRASIVAAVKNAGFTFVALDLEGYRLGSLNPADRLRRDK